MLNIYVVTLHQSLECFTWYLVEVDCVRFKGEPSKISRGLAVSPIVKTKALPAVLASFKAHWGRGESELWMRIADGRRWLFFTCQTPKTTGSDECRVSVGSFRLVVSFRLIYLPSGNYNRLKQLWRGSLAAFSMPKDFAQCSLTVWFRLVGRCLTKFKRREIFCSCRANVDGRTLYFLLLWQSVFYRHRI